MFCVKKLISLHTGLQIDQFFFVGPWPNVYVRVSSQLYIWTRKSNSAEKNYLCGFSESEGLSNDQTILWIQNFASKFFSGLIKANPPKNALYHSVQMVLVDPCDKFISRFW